MRFVYLVRDFGGKTLSVGEMEADSEEDFYNILEEESLNSDTQVWLISSEDDAGLKQTMKTLQEAQDLLMKFSVERR